VTRIERFTSRADAELARSVLEANGIPAYVSGDDAGGLHPDIPYGIGGTAVVVPDERYEESIALLDVELGDRVSDAELEAAALAATPAPSTASERPTGRSTLGASGEQGTPATRRSGRQRPVFVVVLLVMLAAVVAAAGLVTLYQVLGWNV
jgi:hypothetical protein